MGRHWRRWVTAGAAILLLPVAVAALDGSGIGSPAYAACAKVPSDFNGDGHADVASGEPGYYSDAIQGSGAVQIIYGSSTGMSSHHGLLDETSFGAILDPAASDHFGEGLASGYFNGDCYADLAIIVPSRNEFVVAYGSANGLAGTDGAVFPGNQFSAGTTGITVAITSGDFNKDGYADVAFGAPSSNAFSGGIGVVLGSASGLSMTGAEWITQNSPGIPGSSEPDDRFGFAVAAGDFTGDGFADLAVGAPDEGLGTVRSTGQVTVIKGSASGLSLSGASAWNESTPGVPGTAETNDSFGFALAAGDVTGDGKADLVVGVVGESLGTGQLQGAVTFLRGASGGLTATGAQSWTQDSAGVPGTAENFDEFGYILAVGDFNGDGHADVAIGDPLEAIGALTEAGSVTVLYGRSTGLTGSGAQAWTQDSSGVVGGAEAADEFGWSVLALRVRSTSRADLVIGVQGESLTADNLHEGAVALLPGSSTRVTATGNQLIGAGALSGGARAQDYLGTALA